MPQSDVNMWGVGAWYPLSFSGLSPGIHTLTLGVSGKKSSYSKNYFVNVREFWVGR